MPFSFIESTFVQSGFIAEITDALTLEFVTILQTEEDKEKEEKTKTKTKTVKVRKPSFVFTSSVFRERSPFIQMDYLKMIVFD